MKQLDEIQKENYFKVPDNYFEELPMRLQARLPDKPYEKLSWRPLLSYAIPSVLIFLLFTWILALNFSREDRIEYLGEISTEEALEYLQYADITTAEIVEGILTGEEMEEVLKAPTADELYLLEENILESIDWTEDEYQTELLQTI